MVNDGDFSPLWRWCIENNNRNIWQIICPFFEEKLIFLKCILKASPLYYDSWKNIEKKNDDKNIGNKKKGICILFISSLYDGWNNNNSEHVEFKFIKKLIEEVHKIKKVISAIIK